jgi:hypothetical protein
MLGSRLLGGVLPITTPQGTVDPAVAEQLRRQSLLLMSLGMLASKNRGADMWSGIAQGLGAGLGNYNERMAEAFRNQITAEEDRRRTEEAVDRRQIARREDQWRMYEAQQRAKEREQMEKDRAEQTKNLRTTTRITSERYRLEQLDRQRMRELLDKSKGDLANLTPAERTELNILSGGTLQGELATQYRDPLYLFGQGGGLGALPAPPRNRLRDMP